MFSEWLFDQCWPPVFNVNIGKFNITVPMSNQKDQDDNVKEEVNVYNIEVCKFGGADGCGYQDKYDNMVMTLILSSFGMDSKKGEYIQRISHG